MENTHFNSIPYWWGTGHGHSNPFYEEINVTYVALLVTGLCLGLPALIGIIIFCCKYREPRDLSVFVVSLLFTAILQSLSTPVVAMSMLSSTCTSTICFKLVILWLSMRRCVVIFHLLVALEFILSQTFLQSVYLSVPVVLTLELVSILSFEVIEADVALGAVATCLALTTCIVAATSKCTDKSKLIVLAVAMVSFVGTYLTSFIMECMIYNGHQVFERPYLISVCLTNLRLIMDALLCWLVCRIPPRGPPPQTNIALENPNYP